MEKFMNKKQGKEYVFVREKGMKLLDTSTSKEIEVTEKSAQLLTQSNNKYKYILNSLRDQCCQLGTIAKLLIVSSYDNIEVIETTVLALDCDGDLLSHYKSRDVALTENIIDLLCATYIEGNPDDVFMEYPEVFS